METRLEERPVISVVFWSPSPGADNEVSERYMKWLLEVYHPLMMKLPELVGIDDYWIVRETQPEYPSMGGLFHFKNLSDWRGYTATSIGQDIMKENSLWIERGITDNIWSAAYALIRSLRSKPAFTSANKDTRITDAPIILLEAYRLSAEEQEKYVKWFNEFGCKIFIPLFLKLPGVVGYDWYEDSGLRRRQEAREHEYPKYLSIIYFETLIAYDSFMKSAELAGFLRTMRSIFPRGLNYKWHVQYQLIKSFRK